MSSDIAKNSTVWIEHTQTGDVYYKVHLIYSREPGEIEFCKVCSKGRLSLMGHVVQNGMWDDKIMAVTACDNCCAVTVFIYHVDSGSMALPERGTCDDETIIPI